MRRGDSASHRPTNRLSEEDGAVAVIFALLLIVLLGFAAVAVDISGLYVERRHAQTAADVGVLSGAQFAGIDTSDTPAEARQAVIDEVESITAGNLDSTDWAACVDASRPAEFSTVAGETDCISFTFGLTKIRVRVPDQSFNTYFAGVLGIHTLRTAANAEVETFDLKNGDILPFGIPTADADATVGCPSDHPNGLYPCDGPASGNFNRLQVRQWGTSPPLPTHDCTHSNGMFEDNIANGVDHPLGIFPQNPGYDVDLCADPNVANPPGIVQSNTGVAQSTLAPGFVTGSTGGSGFDGRFTDTPYPTSNIMGYAVDNKPLWEFITNYPGGPALANAPDSCQGTSFSAGVNEDWDEDLWVSLGMDPLLDDPDYDGTAASVREERASFEHMARCLREYTQGVWDPGPGYIGQGDPANDYSGAFYDAATTGSGVLFGQAGAGSNTALGVYDLQLSPRWAWSPIGAFSNGVSQFPITRYKPIFVQTLVSNCNAHGCSWVWNAGETQDVGIPAGNKIASGMSFQLPDSTLPQEVIDFGPNSEYVADYTLTK
jgi:hypothetical protein